MREVDRLFSLVILQADCFPIIMRCDSFNTQNYYINTFLKIKTFVSTSGSVGRLNMNDLLQDVLSVSTPVVRKGAARFRKTYLTLC